MALNPSDILALIKDSPTPLTKRDIARAFKIKGGEHRVALKQILKSLEKEEAIIKHPGGGYSIPEGLPRVTVLEIIDTDIDGDLMAAPVNWNEEFKGAPPSIFVAPEKKGHHVLKPKDRILARLKREPDGVYKAYIIKRLDDAKGRVMGLLRIHKGGNAILSPPIKRRNTNLKCPPGIRVVRKTVTWLLVKFNRPVG